MQYHSVTIFNKTLGYYTNDKPNLPTILGQTRGTSVHEPIEYAETLPRETDKSWLRADFEQERKDADDLAASRA